MMTSSLDSDVDRNAVEQLIQIERAHSTAIEQEMEALLTSVRRLQFKKAVHESQIRHYQGLITMARRLPPELLAAIFELCVDDGWTRMPLVASGVCTEWRKAALYTPSVWSRVFVNLENKDPVGRTLFWLQNARQSALDITLDFRNHHGYAEDIVRLLVRHASQWRSLTLNSAFLSLANDTLTCCQDVAFPLLRSVSISIDEELDVAQEDSSLFPLTDHFHQSPDLHTLLVRRNILPSVSSIPATITHLTISLPAYRLPDMVTIRSIVDLLQQTSATLTSLTVSVPRGTERQFAPDGDPLNVAELDSLESLTIAGSSDLFALLPHIQARSLQNLTLRSTSNVFGMPQANHGAHLLQFIDNSSPPLQLLDIHDLDISEEVLAVALPRLNSLQTLRLHESEITDDVLGLLVQECPALQTVDFRWCGLMSGPALVALVRARCTSNNPLTSITLINCAGVRDTDIIGMAEFTICRVIMNSTDDYCKPIGCCQNEMYRKRLERGQLLYTVEPKRRRRIILNS